MRIGTINTYPLIERIRMSEIGNIFSLLYLLSKIVFKYIIHNREPKLKSHIIKFFFNLSEYPCLYLHHFSLSAALFSLAYRLAASRRSSLYGAVSRKEKRPFAISNSMQPVSGSASVLQHSSAYHPICSRSLDDEKNDAV